MAGDSDPNRNGAEAGSEAKIVSPQMAGSSPPEDGEGAAHERQNVNQYQERFVYAPIRSIVRWADGHNGAITAVATVVIAIATIVNVVYVGGQLAEMKSTGIQTDTLIETNRKLVDAATEQASASVISAQTAQDTLLASQRAWVGPSTAKIEGAIEASKEVKAVVTVVNTGREPGKNLFWDVVGIPTDSIEDHNGIPAFIVRKYIEACFNTPSQYRRQVIFPSAGGFGGGGFTFTTAIGAEKIDDGIVDGTKSLLVQGCLAYDAFGKTHHTAFCYFYNAKLTKPEALNICTGGTDAD
jgi:hypothetical protein